jgi:hypothetical protein
VRSLKTYPQFRHLYSLGRVLLHDLFQQINKLGVGVIRYSYALPIRQFDLSTDPKGNSLVMYYGLTELQDATMPKGQAAKQKAI